jgi:hemoglobin
MRTRFRVWTALVLAGLMSVSFTWAQTVGEGKQPDTKALDKQLYDTLRDVINTGRDLFNRFGDYSGCYRVFQGSLMTAKPLLAHRPDLQKVIDAGLAEAGGLAYMHQRAFALRKTLDTVRAGLKSGEPIPVGPEKVESLKDGKAEKTEWERLGGEENVRRILDEFLINAAADPKVNLFRDGKFKMDEKQIAALKKKLVDLISEISGGPYKYTGRSMRDSHEGMGITDSEFDAHAGHLGAALKKNGIGQAEIDSIMKKIAGTRPEIVEVKKPEEKKDDNKDPVKGASVSGKVTFKGLPLPGGTITYYSGGAAYSAKIEADGTYKVVDLPSAEYRVSIDSAKVAIPARYGNPRLSELSAKIQAGTNTIDLSLN